MNCFGQPPENTNSVILNSNQENRLQEESIEETELLEFKMDSSEFNKKESVPQASKSKKFLSDGYSKVGSQSQIKSIQVLESESNRSKYQSNSRSPSIESQSVMDSEVERLRVIDDQSFDYHLYNYMSGNYDVSRQESLYQAESLDGDNQEVQRLMVANSLAIGDVTGTGIGLKKIVNNGTLSKETIAYTEDVLKSAKGNEILLTHGTNDSYGAFYNQYLNPIEFNSICIVSLDLMRSESYRSLLIKKGIKVPESESIDVQFFTEFCTINANKGISISMTFPLDYLKPIANHLVPYGLVLRTGKQKPLCASDLDDLWNNGLNKKNLNEYHSSESINYAKNYAPTRVILKNFHDSNKSNHYMKSTNDQQKIKDKLDKKH